MATDLWNAVVEIFVHQFLPSCLPMFCSNMHWMSWSIVKEYYSIRIRILFLIFRNKERHIRLTKSGTFFTKINAWKILWCNKSFSRYRAQNHNGIAVQSRPVTLNRTLSYLNTNILVFHDTIDRSIFCRGNGFNNYSEFLLKWNQQLCAKCNVL